MGEICQELQIDVKTKQTKEKNFRNFNGENLIKIVNKPSFIKINDLSLNLLTLPTTSIITFNLNKYNKRSKAARQQQLLKK